MIIEPPLSLPVYSCSCDPFPVRFDGSKMLVASSISSIASLGDLKFLFLCGVVNLPKTRFLLTVIFFIKIYLVLHCSKKIVMYMLRLESSAIGEIVGGTMLPALVDRLIELDVEIGWDGKMQQEDAKCIFEMDIDRRHC
ncbi:hypothetical protein P8452_77290 [Trifolium repens]|nr:hypothetical protein P8452_77290 [Trifolium repens]